MERIKTGIIGLDNIINGGFFKNSVNVIVGGSGTGKTTFALQFLLEGLKNGEDGLYITMEQSRESIIENAKMLGFDEIEDYVDKHLFFMETRGAEFEHWVRNILPPLVEKHKNYEVDTRIVIDPLTSLMWEISEKNKQRLIITDLFDQMRTVGTSLVTVEQYGSSKELLLTEEVGVPIYLSDAAFNLVYLGFEGEYSRILRVIKMRGTAHSEKVNSLYFVNGFGVIIIDEASKEESREELPKYDSIFENAISQVETSHLDDKIKNSLIKTLKNAQKSWKIRAKPDQIISDFLKTYNIEFKYQTSAIDF